MRTFKSQDMQRNCATLQEAAIAEPVIITYHDRPRLVLMSMEEFDRLRGRQKSVNSAEDLPHNLVEELDTMDQKDAFEAEDEPGYSRGPNP